ncbi:MAG TPA: hypothetical protein VGY54_01860 [Polyangiaceae bacterium]|nr:hypothetical protein [Polyangiaceae bacterium]
MNDVDIPPLTDSVRALVRRVAAIEAAPQGARARVLARVEAVIGPPNGGGGYSSGARPVAEPAEAPRHAALPRVLPLAASFALGGALGATLMHSVMRRSASNEPERVVYVERTPATAFATTSVESAASPPSQASVPAPAAPQRAPFAGTRNQLAEERALLDVARGALEREDAAQALAAIEKHERTFANGILVQEREAMAIRALVMMGRVDDARARAGRFRKHFPDSVLLPTIESTISSVPAR